MPRKILNAGTLPGTVTLPLKLRMDVEPYKRFVAVPLSIAVSCFAACSGLKSGVDQSDDAVVEAAGMLNGFWNGETTEERRNLGFEIRGGSLARLRFNWNCGGPGSTESVWYPPTVLFNRDVVEEPDDENALTYAISGRFTSSTSAEGELTLSRARPDCEHTERWTAAKAVCGDGERKWPETCDPPAAGATPACDDQCQLVVTREKEPNDTPETAMRVQFPAVISGSLIEGDARDTYELENTMSTPLHVLFETRGPATGTCDIDTLLELSGKTSPDDDYSGLGNCASQRYRLYPNSAVQVEVRAKGPPIAGYLLSVTKP